MQGAAHAGDVLADQQRHAAVGTLRKDYLAVLQAQLLQRLLVPTQPPDHLRIEGTLICKYDAGGKYYLISASKVKGLLRTHATGRLNEQQTVYHTDACPTHHAGAC